MEGLSKFDDGIENKCTENNECKDLMNVCVSSNSNDNSNENNDDINWGDCDDKLRCLFDQVLMILLRGICAKNGIRPIPPLLGDGCPVDLFKLFCLVRDRGGFRPVSEDKLWGLIAEKFRFDYKLCASLKLIYYKYLDGLDQWLNRIIRDGISSNGSIECGGNFSLLSLELEKRFREFSADVKELGAKVGERGFYEVCSRISEVLNEALDLPDVGNSSKLQNSVIICDLDDDDNLCSDKDFIGDGNECSLDSSRKRKRDVFSEMLSWMMKVAKNPNLHSTEKRAGCFIGKGTEDHDFRSLTLSIREARLHRRYSNSNNDHSLLHQKKIKMHPSMYEDDNPRSHDGVLRSSQRLVSLVKTPLCHCCKPSSVNKCKFGSRSGSLSENGRHIKKRVNTNLPAKKKMAPLVDDTPGETLVLIGPRFQANVPIWTGTISESDPKWLGTQIWVPGSQEDLSYPQSEQPGKGRSGVCKCPFPGSVECHRFHIAENRFHMRKKLGLAFCYWKFDHMGEEVSLSWTAEDEKKFKHVVKLNSPHLGKSYFPNKRITDLISYYFNVYRINRRSYQNRVTPKEIDSDDDEKEFGSVSEAFGLNAVRVPSSEPLICYRNEQAFDLD